MRRFRLAATGVLGSIAGWMLGPKLKAAFAAGRETVTPVPPAPSPAPTPSKGGGSGKKGNYGATWTLLPGIPGDTQVKLDPGWMAQNLVTVSPPLLPGIRLTLHKDVVGPFNNFLAAAQAAGVLKDIITVQSFNPRLVRGSTTTLSMHATGRAVDINAEWNPQGKAPIPEGEKGSVVRLFPIAEQTGWKNGRGFRTPDPHHFQFD